MFRWRKLGRIFDPTQVTGRPWLREFAQAPATLVFDDFVRVYFACRPPRDENGQYVSYTGFVDLDRRDLTKVVAIADAPVMPLGERGAFDEFGTYPMSVIRHDGAVLAWYGGWTRCESTPYNVAIGAAVSHDDGRSFERLGPGPALSYTLEEPTTISGPKIRRFGDRWYLFYVAGTGWKVAGARRESVFKLRVATSDDGVSWERSGRDLVPSRLEEDECQASPDVFFHAGRYHMFFSYKYSTDFRNGARGYRIGYASSSDLVTWRRDDERAGIDVSPDGWDGESIAYPHVLDLDGRQHLFYLGNEVGRYGFGLAELEGYDP
jgi:hypothetical protein